MPNRKRRVSQRRHGTRDLVLKALEDTRKGPAVATMAVIRQVRKLAGHRIPEETIRSSLKTLVRQRVVKGRKSGHEKVYKLVQDQLGAAPPSPRPSPGATTQRSSLERAELAVPQPALPHKLAVGEVLVLEIGATHVETATNVHGTVVIERHARPR